MNEDKDKLPNYKLILMFDAVPSSGYGDFLADLLSTVFGVGLALEQVWQTAYGDSPSHMFVFSSESYESIAEFLLTDTWADLEDQIHDYAANYSRRIVKTNHDFPVVGGSHN